jgi:hypothetical protein
MSVAAAIPKLVVSDPPAGRDEVFAAALSGLSPFAPLLAALSGDGSAAKASVATLLRALVDEGARFAETPAGRHWRAILADSPAVARGWLLWSQANIDYYLRNAAPTRDSPAILLEDMLKQLADTDLATLTAQLSRIGIDLAAAARSENGAPR